MTETLPAQGEADETDASAAATAEPNAPKPPVTAITFPAKSTRMLLTLFDLLE